MNRVEFMEELETLLKCISEEEKKEALEYYEAYFEDAGKEKEAEVIKELKSPKKVAESIKAGLRGEDRAIYTERGYEEEKEKVENNGVSLKKQLDSSEKISLEKDDTGQKIFGQGAEANRSGDGENRQQGYTKQYESNDYEKKNHTTAIIIAVITSPIWGAVLLAVLGAVLGIIGGIIGLIAGIFFTAIGLLIGGIAAVLHGLVMLTGTISLGLLEIGLGLLCISGGGMLLWGSLLLGTKAIPAFVKWMIKKIKKIFHREREYV